MTAYDALFRQVLTRTDAETAHRAAFGAIRAAGPVLAPLGRRVRHHAAPVRAMGLTFPGVLGLAAGFDKNAEGVDALAALGFGCVEHPRMDISVHCDGKLYGWIPSRHGATILPQ